MPIINHQIADMFKEMADLLEIEGDNPYRIRAYRNTARIVDSFPQQVADLLRQGQDLTKWPGIGKAMAEKISTIVKTGEFAQLEAEEKRIPPVLRELAKVPGLGPKKIKAIYYAYPIGSVADLQKLVEEGKISRIKGFGKKMQETIKANLQCIADAPR